MTLASGPGGRARRSVAPGALLLFVLLLLAAPAGAQAPLPLSPVPRELYQEARAREARGDAEGAAARYRAVLRHDPDFTRAAMDLARVRWNLGDLEGAEAAYRLAPDDDVDALEGLGRVLLAQGRPREAAEVFRRLGVYESSSAEPTRLEAHATSAFDVDRAVLLFRRYLSQHDPGRDAAAAADTGARIAQVLLEQGEAERGLALLDEAQAELPGAAATEVFSERLDELRIEQEARRLARSAAEPLPAELRERLEAARALYAEGHLEAARDGLRALRDEAPRSPEVWAALADVHEALGDIGAADRALQTAEGLSPFEPRYPARLGEVLATWYGGTRDAEAAAAWERALRLDPTWAALWFDKARVELRLGRSDEAAASLDRYLALAPDGPHAAEAARLRAGMERERPPAPELPEAEGCPPGVTPSVCTAFWRAVVLQKRGRVEDALGELRGVRFAAPRFLRAINLEASLRLQQGDRDAAIGLYRESLAVEPDQDAVIMLLWQLLRDSGRPGEADELLDRVDAEGAGIAHFLLAREAWRGWQPFEARRELDAYFAAETSGRYHDEARALRAEVDQFMDRLWTGLGLGGLVLVVGVPGWLGWRRSGHGIEELLQRAPAAWRDVARVGSAVRHEVLKHHTTVLPAVADALDGGDPEPARWAAERLYGPGGALARFDEYIEALEVAGRVHGVRLNLRHRDPTFGPLIEGMDQLRALRRDLERGRGRALADRLRAVSETLNQRGYRALGALLRRVCVLPLSEELLRGAWERVLADPAFRDQPVPPLHVDLPERPLHLRIWRKDLDDILANLLRNALAASLEEGGGRIGIGVDTETDWITGLERVALRVRDDAPARVTTAMIRSRYIERGLGLTVDLISRHGGSIHVEDEPGWSKAVVVRLPRAERGGGE